MINFNLTLLRVKLQKEGKNLLWGHIKSCLLRSNAAVYHLSAIKRKLEDVKDWPKQENKIFYVLEIEREIGYEVDALMLKLHSLIDITAQVIGGTMGHEPKTNDFWKLKPKEIPKDFSDLITTYRGNKNWKTIKNYSNLTKHVKDIGGTLHIYCENEKIRTRFETDRVRDRQLPTLDVCKFKELINFVEEFVKEMLTLVVKHLWPNSEEDFNSPSWSVSKRL